MRKHTRASEALAASLTLVLSFVALALPFGCECTPRETPDAGGDGGVDATSLDARATDAALTFDARSQDSGRDAPSNNPDAYYASGWSPVPGMFERCSLRTSDTPSTEFEWAYEACPGLPRCERLRAESFPNVADRFPFNSFRIAAASSALPAHLLVVFTWAYPDTAVAQTYISISRAEGVEQVLRSVLEPANTPLCGASAWGTRTDGLSFVFWDWRDADRTLRGARYLLYRLPFGVSSEFQYVTTMTHEGLSGSSPQDLSTSADFIGIRLGLGNRIVAAQNDGSYGFAEPAPPFNFVRQQMRPQVVGESLLTNAPLSPTANGLFMSHLGAPSERIWPVDAVGEVVADEENIVWLQGRAVYETIQLEDAVLWRAPFREGVIDASEAHAVRDFYDVARRYGDGRGAIELGMQLGGGYVATTNGLSTVCHVVRLSDGRMATFSPGPEYRCAAAMYVNATETGFYLLESADTVGTTIQLWMVPHDALTFL